MGRFVVTCRVGPKVEREQFDRLSGALDAIEARGRAVAGGTGARALEPRLMRRFEPVQRVVARLELAGPRRLRGGVDVRGDGSAEGYTGRLRRRLVEQRRGESAYDALRRVLSES